MKKSHFDEKYIERLLNKFMDGETTLDEEDALAFYFRNNDVRPEWEDYKEMFAYFDSGMVDTEMKAEKPKLRIWKPLAIVAAVAAVFVMVFSLQRFYDIMLLDETDMAVIESVREVEDAMVAVAQEELPAEIQPVAKVKKLKRRRSAMTPNRLSEEEMKQLAIKEERRMRIEMARIENEIAEKYGEMLVAEYMLERQLDGEAQELPVVESVGGDAYCIPNNNIMTFIMP